MLPSPLILALPRGGSAKTLPSALFKGTAEEYVLPAGHYEAAGVAWNEASDEASYPSDPEARDTYRREKTNESLACLERVAKWESFVLDARIGLRVQTGLDSIKWVKRKRGWA